MTGKNDFLCLKSNITNTWLKLELCFQTWKHSISSSKYEHLIIFFTLSGFFRVLFIWPVQGNIGHKLEFILVNLCQHFPRKKKSIAVNNIPPSSQKPYVTCFQFVWQVWFTNDMQLFGNDHKFSALQQTPSFSSSYSNVVYWREDRWHCSLPPPWEMIFPRTPSPMQFCESWVPGMI